MPVPKLVLIRDALNKFGGIKAFRTEVLCCCAAPALETNEQLYISRLGTLHPKGYNMDVEVRVHTHPPLPLCQAPSPHLLTTTPSHHLLTTSPLSALHHTLPSPPHHTPLSLLSNIQVEKDLRDRAAGRKKQEVQKEEEEGPDCFCSHRDGKLWLDAAMGGRVEELEYQVKGRTERMQNNEQGSSHKQPSTLTPPLLPVPSTHTSLPSSPLTPPLLPVCSSTRPSLR